MPDKPETLALVMAPPAVSWAEGGLRVHLGEGSWSFGPGDGAEAFRSGGDGGDDRVKCGPSVLAEALGLDEKPRPARLAHWRADRILRAGEEIVHREKIVEGAAEKVSEDKDSGSPFPEYGAALAAAERDGGQAG